MITIYEATAVIQDTDKGHEELKSLVEPERFQNTLERMKKSEINY